LVKKAIAHAPYTTASITSIQTSTYPVIPDENYTDLSKRLTLAEILTRKGFSTIGVHSNPWFSVYNYGKGFSKFVDPLAEANVQSVFFPYAKAAEINNTVVSYLKDSLDRFYLWIHYMDVHDPYMPGKNYFGQELKGCEEIKGFMDIMQNQGNISSEERKILIDLYDNEIRYLDDKIGELLENLRALCDLDKTLLLITADHGQKLGERGYHGHGGANTPVSFFDELLHVPLIIWSKSKEALMDISESGEVDSLVGLIDIAPTIIDILGIEKPKEFMGESLLRNSCEKTVISQGIQCVDPNEVKYFKEGERIQSYRTNHYKLIYREGHIELYDLKEDPMERMDISIEQKEVAEKLKEELFNTLKSIEPTKRETEKTKIKEKIGRLKTQGKM
jgi:arylsulfatase A-like enzyme